MTRYNSLSELPTRYQKQINGGADEKMISALPPTPSKARKSRLNASEADFQKQVIELAKYNGWIVAHFRVARTKDGWSTPVDADGKGFPDLVLVRERVIWAELKSETNKLSPEQKKWRYAIERARQEYYLWRPSMWEKIVEVLK
jgi:hypothetical protein